MQVPPPPDPLAALGEDLILLAVRPRDGKLLTGHRLSFGLAAAELARLAVIGRIDVTRDQIVVVDPAPTHHPELDAALTALAHGWPPPRPATWLGLPRLGIRDAYVDQLVAAGVLGETRPRGLRSWRPGASPPGASPPGGRRPGASPPGGRRFTVLAAERAADARSRLDAIARSGDSRLGPGQLAFGGLAAAIGLTRVLYPGRDGRPERDHLFQIATHIAPAQSGKLRPAAPVPSLAPGRDGKPGSAPGGDGKPGSVPGRTTTAPTSATRTTTPQPGAAQGTTDQSGPDGPPVAADSLGGTISAIYAITWAALLASYNLGPRPTIGGLSNWSAVRGRSGGGGSGGGSSGSSGSGGGGSPSHGGGSSTSHQPGGHPGTTPGGHH